VCPPQQAQKAAADEMTIGVAGSQEITRCGRSEQQASWGVADVDIISPRQVPLVLDRRVRRVAGGRQSVDFFWWTQRRAASLSWGASR
jgi:hypothetical protein